ncbi:MAG: hypothetical protein ACRDRG_17000 [Pseudonocardiaceae bacterium]
MANRLLLSVEDLNDDTVHRILDRAVMHAARSVGPRDSGRPIVGLVFLEASLRTRIGFAAAALRLGWHSIDVAERRSSPTSKPESWQDTLRTVAGYADVLIARIGHPLSRAELAHWLRRPLLNGGDSGPAAEHPSQALIDLFAMEQLGPVTDLRIAVCGDLRMRAVRSLLRLLARTPPRSLVLITDPALADDEPSPAPLLPITEHRPPWDLADIDVLYVAGIPYGALPEPGRSRLRVGATALAELRRDSIVLSPLPVIDEIHPDVRSDGRLKMFQQSDQGLYVRMALLEELVSPLP